jgi:hypothetical protein
VIECVNSSTLPYHSRCAPPPLHAPTRHCSCKDMPLPGRALHLRACTDITEVIAGIPRSRDIPHLPPEVEFPPAWQTLVRVPKVPGMPGALLSVRGRHRSGLPSNSKTPSHSRSGCGEQCRCPLVQPCPRCQEIRTLMSCQTAACKPPAGCTMQAPGSQDEDPSATRNRTADGCNLGRTCGRVQCLNESQATSVSPSSHSSPLISHLPLPSSHLPLLTPHGSSPPTHDPPICPSTL